MKHGNIGGLFFLSSSINISSELGLKCTSSDEEGLMYSLGQIQAEITGILLDTQLALQKENHKNVHVCIYSKAALTALQK